MDYLLTIYNIGFIQDVGEHGAVGFSAYATSEEQCNDGDKIIFDAIVSNIGNHYNTDTYKFTCPYHGLYLFNVNIVAYHSNQMVVQIVHENTDLLGGYTYPDHYETGSATVVTECKAEESVWVRCDDIDNAMHAGSRFSHFTGTLIQAYI